MIGQQFGRWAVVGKVGANHNNKMQWLCKCSCGVEKVVIGASLKSGRSKSCGCYVKGERKIWIKHGYCGTRVYRTWKNIKTRCLSPNSPRYSSYGGRGITICDRWLQFENFLSDMGDVPFPLAQIDRIDNNKGYSPENCKWVTPSANCRNKRDNHLLIHDGVSHCMTEWGEIYGVDRSVIKGRLKRGWPTSEALMTPARHMKPMTRRYENVDK